jgi:hypothetical protein
MSLGDAGNFAKGMSDSISQYLQSVTSFEMQKQNYLWQKSVDLAMKPERSYTVGMLKSLNPKFKNLNLSDETEIAAADLSEFAALLPKDDDSDSSNFLTVPEAASHLFMLGVPEPKVDEILKDFAKRKTNRVSKNVLDEAARAHGLNPSATEQRLRIFAASVDPTDEDFLSKFKAWNSKIDEYVRPSKASSRIPLPTTQAPAVAQKAGEVFGQYIEQGMSQAEALDKVTDQLAEIYDADGVKAVLAEIDNASKPKRASTPGIKSLLRSLLQ